MTASPGMALGALLLELPEWRVAAWGRIGVVWFLGDKTGEDVVGRECVVDGVWCWGEGVEAASEAKKRKEMNRPRGEMNPEQHSPLAV